MNHWPESLALLPLDWPKEAAGTTPGDLRRFATQRFSSRIRMPAKFPTPNFLDFKSEQAHPMHNIPANRASGGTLYFDGDHNLNALTGALELMGISKCDYHYAAFSMRSEDPVKYRFLDQLRLVPHLALSRVFELTIAPPPPQSISMLDAVMAFVDVQKKYWESDDLLGLLGGGGDSDDFEALGFGVTVENTQWGIVRVWSRPWLVMK